MSLMKPNQVLEMFSSSVFCRDFELTKKSDTGTGTQNQKIRDSGPRLKIKKSEIGDWDRHSDFRDEGFRDSNLGD